METGCTLPLPDPRITSVYFTMFVQDFHIETGGTPRCDCSWWEAAQLKRGKWVPVHSLTIMEGEGSMPSR